MVTRPSPKITHVGRLPGFFHMKGEPFRTRIDGEHEANYYAQNKIEREFPPIDSPHKPPSSRPLLDPDVPIASARLFIGRHYLPADHKPGVYGIHHFRGRYYRWTGTHYESTEDTTVRKQLYGFLHSAVARKKGMFVPFNATRPKVSLVEHALMSGIHLNSKFNPPFWIISDDHPPVEERRLIACKNGLVDIETRKLEPHKPEFFNIHSLPFEFDPDAQKPERWLKFLKDIWPDDREARETLQEIMGLLLTTDTSHQKLFMTVGPKRGGKGTIARIMGKLYGENNVVYPTLSSLGSHFGMQTLIDKSVAIISDARVGVANSNVLAERLLSISGEDSQSIDIKHEAAWTGKPNARLFIMTNELPRIGETSGALASRFILLTMKQSFYGKEDLGLSSKLMTELPGNPQLGNGWSRSIARTGSVRSPDIFEAGHRASRGLGLTCRCVRSQMVCDRS